MCREPVTLGGGMTMEKPGPGWLGSPVKAPLSSHQL